MWGRGSVNSRANFDLITYSCTVSLPAREASQSVCLALPHAHIITAQKYENTCLQSYTRHTQTEGFELNNLSHISTKTHCCITLLPQPKRYVQHSYFVWRHSFFSFLPLFYSGVGTFTLCSWHTGVCVVQENNIYTMWSCATSDLS